MRRFMTRLIRVLCAILAMGIGSAFAQGFTPTPEQIQQFKNMSPAQQQQMAEAAGIDLNALLGSRQSNNNQPVLTEDIQPRSATVDSKKDAETESETEDSATKKNSDPTKLPLFGRDLFASGVEAFRPATDIPVPANYVLGPGDTLVIQLYGKENIAHSLVLNREGQIQFPQIGPVTLAGLTFEKAQKVIEQIVSEQMIGIKASVTMGALRTIRIFVLGEVERPGSFTVGSLATMTNALFASGGITEVGSMRNVQLKRGGQVITSLDLYDLLLLGDTSKDSRLLPGDVIFVPPIGKTVSVTGQVKRPATYEIKKEATVNTLIQLAGGLTNNAYLPISYLVRHDSFGERTLINIDLSTPQGKQYELQDGDLLSIASKLDFVNNQVTLAGHVKRPGPRSWKPDLRFTDLIPSPRELLPNPDIDIALIQRFSLETRRVEVLLFSPTEAWQSPGSAKDPLLQGFDVVQLFNYDDKRDEQLADVVTQLEAQARFNERKKVVAISGSVRFPGVYPISEGMTTKDLIQLAGGLTESALDTNGEITRYGIDEERRRVVIHIAVNFSDEPVPIEPGDTLQVKQIPLWKQKETVEILGEVMFPGTYTILPGETLVDVLTRAGGLTPHAYPLGAVFSRQELRELEQQRLTELKDKLQSEIAARSAGLATGQEEIGVEEAEQLIKNLNSIKPLGRMVIDLPAILENSAHHDFQLEHGDTLTIPRYKPSVTVVGEVQYPTSHFYDPSLDAQTYIERSGGFKKNADEARVYIVKANGSVMQPDNSAWFRSNKGRIQPGDTIVVPLETDRVDKLTVWARATQIIYQAALGAAALKAF
ncbi:ATPase [Saccharophagus sp. K07]|nr:ATPase [Saccharophagus sp. K07]